MSVCFCGWKKLYLPDQTELPLSVYNSFPIEEIRVTSTSIYFDSGYHSVLFGCVQKQTSQCGFLTHIHTQSVVLYLFSPRIMKQTGLHSVRCITSALISVHYSLSCLTCIQSSVVTRCYFANESPPAVCMYNAVSDDLQYKITGCILLLRNRKARSIYFLMHDTEQDSTNCGKQLQRLCCVEGLSL